MSWVERRRRWSGVGTLLLLLVVRVVVVVVVGVGWCCWVLWVKCCVVVDECSFRLEESAWVIEACVV